MFSDSQRLGNFLREINYKDIQEFPVLIEEETKINVEEVKGKPEANSIWTEENISKGKGQQ